MVNSMAANVHTFRLQLPDLSRAEESRLVQSTRTDEKSRCEATPQQRGQHDLDIGSVAVIERQPHVRLSLDKAQDALEKVLI
jgi:hypothetical protein